MKLVYGIDENTLYDEHIYKQHYTKHKDSVLEYFKNRAEDLLVINLAHEQAENDLGRFLGVANRERLLPHLNRTE